MDRIDYKGSSLFPSDIASLQPGRWIGDAVVSYYFAVLQAEAEARNLADGLFLMDPMVSQMVVYAETQEDVDFDLGSCELDRKRYTFAWSFFLCSTLSINLLTCCAQVNFDPGQRQFESKQNRGRFALVIAGVRCRTENF